VPRTCAAPSCTQTSAYRGGRHGEGLALSPDLAAGYHALEVVVRFPERPTNETCERSVGFFSLTVAAAQV